MIVVFMALFGMAILAHSWIYLLVEVGIVLLVAIIWGLITGTFAEVNDQAIEMDRLRRDLIEKDSLIRYLRTEKGQRDAASYRAVSTHQAGSK